MILTEGAKFSKQLINAAFNDPNFTFGFEIEAYFTNPTALIKKIEKKVKSSVSYDDDEQWYHKPLSQITFYDLITYFVPLHVRKEELYNPNIDSDNQSRLVISDRIDAAVPGDMSTSEKFTALRNKQKMFHIMANLKIAPKYGLMATPEQNFKLLDAIKEKNVFKILKTFPKIEDLGIRMFQRGEEALEFNISTNPGYRQLFYGFIAEQLEFVLGSQVIFKDDSKTKDGQSYDSWVITRDISLDNEDGEKMVGFELISPILNAMTGLRMLKKLFDAMNEKDVFGVPGMGIVTDETTGLHLNIGMKGVDIDYTKMLFLMGDEYIAKKFQRDQSDMAALTFNQMKSNIINNPNLIIDVADELSKKGATNDVVQRFIEKVKKYIPVDKMQSVNLEKFLKQDAGFVEFRSVGNTNYHKRFGDIFSVVRQLVTVMYVATEPKIYRNEYYKMIYRLLTGIKTAQTSPA